MSHNSRGTFSVSSCSLWSLWQGPERNPGKGYALRYIFYYAPETPLMSSQPKFLISLPCTWLLLGAFVAFEWNRNWDANWYDVSFLLCKIFLCNLTQSCKVTRSKDFGFNASKKKTGDRQGKMLVNIKPIKYSHSSTIYYISWVLIPIRIRSHSWKNIHAAMHKYLWTIC